MKQVFLLILGLCSLQIYATVTVDQDLCPVEFHGKVRAIVEEVGPDKPLQSQQVVFTNQKTIKGEVKEQVSVNVLKEGPFPVEQDKEYRVLLRKGKLCWIEQI